MFDALLTMIRDDAGTAAVEYSIVLSVFAISTIGIFQLFVNASGTQLTTTQSTLQTTAMSVPAPVPTPT